MTVRMKAAERKEQILGVAVSAFAEDGFAATGTDKISRRAGISQTYVIRLFGSKHQLFLAVLHRAWDALETIVRSAAYPASPVELSENGRNYGIFLSEQELMQIILQSFAASSDPVIGDATRERFAGVYRLMRTLPDTSATRTHQFLAVGMLLTAMTAMRVIGPDAVPTSWADEILEDLEPGIE